MFGYPLGTEGEYKGLYHVMQGIMLYSYAEGAVSGADSTSSWTSEVRSAALTVRMVMADECFRDLAALEPDLDLLMARC